MRSGGRIANNWILDTYESGISYYAGHPAGTPDLLIGGNVCINSGLNGSDTDIKIRTDPSAGANLVSSIVIGNNFLTMEARTEVSVGTGYGGVTITGSGGVGDAGNTRMSDLAARLLLPDFAWSEPSIAITDAFEQAGDAASHTFDLAPAGTPRDRVLSCTLHHYDQRGLARRPRSGSTASRRRSPAPRRSSTGRMRWGPKAVPSSTTTSPIPGRRSSPRARPSPSRSRCPPSCPGSSARWRG
jgi:hypothetical protein